MKIMKTLVILIVVNIISIGHIQSQSKIRSWKTDEDFDPKFNKMVVIGMFEGRNIRIDME